MICKSLHSYFINILQGNNVFESRVEQLSEIWIIIRRIGYIRRNNELPVMNNEDEMAVTQVKHLERTFKKVHSSLQRRKGRVEKELDIRIPEDCQNFHPKLKGMFLLFLPTQAHPSIFSVIITYATLHFLQMLSMREFERVSD